MITKDELNAIKSEVNALEVLEAGTYLCGHPEVNDPIGVYLAVAENSFMLMARRHSESTAKRFIGDIPKKAIKQISIEDKTTIQSRITAARLLTVGIFAFAWKKKEADEVAFVVIEWTDSKNMDNKTTFKFEGASSLATANALRNTILKYL